MKKKVALVLHSIDVIFSPDGGVKGGANRVNLLLLQALAADLTIELTLITLVGDVKVVEGVDHYFFFDKSIYTDKTEVLHQISLFLADNPQDTVLFSDVIAPFGSTLFHSHSFAHRQAIKPWWVKPFTALATRKRHRIQVEALGEVTNRQFFTVSQAVKDDWVQHFGMDANLVHVAYPGVALPTHPPEVEPLQDSLHRPPVFGMVNTSSLKKGGLLFIMALGLLKASGHLFSVRMIHPKIKKDPLTSILIFCLGLKSNITILPFQADTTAFYTSIDAFVMPSLHEAFGLVITEAMSHGVIPIVSSTAGASEIIQHGETGFVFNLSKQPIWQLFKVLQQFDFIVNNDIYNKMRSNIQTFIKTLTWQRFTEVIIQQL
jgi:glycosyltransferase involved in cell wall biosynthesis